MPVQRHCVLPATPMTPPSPFRALPYPRATEPRTTNPRATDRRATDLRATDRRATDPRATDYRVIIDPRSCDNYMAPPNTPPPPFSALPSPWATADPRATDPRSTADKACTCAHPLLVPSYILAVLGFSTLLGGLMCMVGPVSSECPNSLRVGLSVSGALLAVLSFAYCVILQCAHGRALRRWRAMHRGDVHVAAGAPWVTSEPLKPPAYTPRETAPPPYSPPPSPEGTRPHLGTGGVLPARGSFSARDSDRVVIGIPGGSSQSLRVETLPPSYGDQTHEPEREEHSPTI